MLDGSIDVKIDQAREQKLHKFKSENSDLIRAAHSECSVQDTLLTLCSSTGETSPRNKFVQTALSYALSHVSHHGIQDALPLDILILADTDYYSHGETSKPCPNNPQSRFRDFNVKLQNANKTGLGSSAALVTAFVSAIILHRLSIKHVDDDMRRKLHNLAQIAHCVAQGKIGSGFDVAAAVYGACIYRRFSPSIFENIGAPGDQNFKTQLVKTIDDVEHKIWDTEIDATALDLPNGLRLVMCDVDCGSETPGMVKKVMAWRKDNPKDSSILWESLSQANMKLAKELHGLGQTLRTNWTPLADNILVIRSLLREMSSKADVPIEPPVQAHLLDGASAIDGVVGGVVPGAGGYDALAILLEDRAEVINKLQEFLQTYKSPVDLEQETKIGKIRLLDVKQEADGVILESFEQYVGWL